jgi:GMP synthase-like glutamine amidotransferase
VLRVHYLQHVPFEGLGSIGPWLTARRAQVSSTQLYAAPTLPPLAEFDALIVMGGPMSVNDEQLLPWLEPEKRFVAAAIDAGKTVLGICLGAQLIAAARGAPVRANGAREIGWHPLERVADSPFGHLVAPPGHAFHWHGETYALPAGAQRLARSAACEQQAFVLGDRVLGLQYHLEMTLSGAQALCTACAEELAPAPYVQSSAEMLREPARFARINLAMDALLDALLPA